MILKKGADHDNIQVPAPDLTGHHLRLLSIQKPPEERDLLEGAGRSGFVFCQFCEDI